jgi:hypothetical protein
VAAELGRLLRVLQQRRVLRGKAEVIAAKVPIIKCHISVGAGSIPTDICLGAANGAEAVPFILQQVLLHSHVLAFAPAASRRSPCCALCDHGRARKASNLLHDCQQA